MASIFFFLGTKVRLGVIENNINKTIARFGHTYLLVVLCFPFTRVKDKYINNLYLAEWNERKYKCSPLYRVTIKHWSASATARF